MSRVNDNRDILLSIGDVVQATGLTEATLRTWERRFDFPQPQREPSGHRRYAVKEVERILRVIAARERGIALPVAIERARLVPPGVPSLFAQLRERRPDLQPMTVCKRHLTALAHAIEEESPGDRLTSLVAGNSLFDTRLRIRNAEALARLKRAVEGTPEGEPITEREIAGQRVIITGGSSGIGLAVAEQLARDGAEIALLARNELGLGAAKKARRVRGRSADAG